MSEIFFETRAKFLQASRKRFAGWGEANNHRQTGAAIEEFHDLFVIASSYCDRLRWMHKPKPIWYRQQQLNRDRCDQWIGHTPYGKMFSRISKMTSGARLASKRSKTNGRDRPPVRL